MKKIIASASLAALGAASLAEAMIFFINYFPVYTQFRPRTACFEK